MGPLNQIILLSIFVDCPNDLPVASSNGHCYGAFENTSTFDEAQQFCSSLNTDLLSILDSQEQQFVDNNLAKRYLFRRMYPKTSITL